MVGPMSCEQRESRHTDWLFMWSHLSVVWCGTIQNVSCLDSVGPSVCPPVFPPIGKEWRLLLLPLGTAPRHAPPLLSNPFLHPLWSPSNGMIAVADICRLSWWSCVNTGGGMGRRKEDDRKDGARKANEGVRKMSERKYEREETDWRYGRGKGTEKKSSWEQILLQMVT